MLKRILSVILGNEISQRGLQFIVFVAQYFMGIGSGSSVDSSGESAVFKMLAQKKQPPYCIFDVGANQGQFLKSALSNLSDGAQIHAFEPASETFRLLSKNAGNNPSVILNNFGMGKEPGSFELFYDKEGSGLASLTSRRLDHFDIKFSQSEKVTIDTIDNYCALRNIDQIDLLKIDVEGHELDVLAGATGLLGSGRIGMVMFEFGGCNIDTRTFFQDFYYLFTGNGMSLFRISPSGYCCPVRAYSELLEQFRTTNFLALRDDLSTALPATDN